MLNVIPIGVPAGVAAWAAGYWLWYLTHDAILTVIGAVVIGALVAQWMYKTFFK